MFYAKSSGNHLQWHDDVIYDHILQLLRALNLAIRRKQVDGLRSIQMSRLTA